MIARLIEWCARNRALAILTVVAATAWGVASLRGTALDAIPDLSDVQVIVFTEWPGQSPNLVEDQITYPISARLLSAPNVRFVRGQSFFGLSFVYAIFEDGTDIYWARSRVLEYLSGVQGQLPSGVVPVIGPDATGVGWVFEYALIDRTGRHDLAELRSLQDWNLRYALASVPGVAEVASVGGFVRQYQVQVDPNKLLARDLPIQDVIRAVRESNEDAGGQVVEFAGHEYAVRGRGRVHALEDLRRIPLGASDGGTPVYLEDVATVSFGPEMRRGLVELDGEGEAVGGIVVMRYGENALRVIDAVKERLAELQAGLPEGVEVVTTYDRSELIEGSIATLRRTLFEELAIVSLVIFVFLLHVRSALIPILTIPVGVVLAFIPMVQQGLTANIMSLGGIAVAIGAMVDASIILVENVHKRLEGWEHAGRPGPRDAVILRAMQEVGPSRLLRAARDHGLVPADLHARGDRGAPVQAARLHEDLRDGLRGRALGDAHARARGAVHPRPDPQRGRASDQPRARARLRAGRALGGAAARHRDRGGAAALRDDGTRGICARQRVHAAAQRGHDPVHADRAAGHVDHRGRGRAAAHGPGAHAVPRGRARVRQDRARRDVFRSGRRSRWSRP